MADVGWQILGLLVCAAFAAGFIDAIAGGGGLLTVPALLLAGFDPVSALATNKLQSTFGSGSATLAFIRRGYLGADILPWVLAAGLGSFLGAQALPYAPRDALQVVLPLALMLVAAYFAFSPRLSLSAGVVTPRPAGLWLGFIPVVGFYDGLFGPGTGSFYMLVFVSLGRLGLLDATARTKAVNFASNLAGLGAFLFAGNIHFTVGLCMAAAQLAGAWLGAQTSIRSGGSWIRPAVVAMSVGLALKLLYDAVAAQLS